MPNASEKLPEVKHYRPRIGRRLKARGAELMVVLKGGSNTFFHKGTNGRWREVLSADELILYDSAADRELTPECRRWLEHGGAV